LVTAPAFCSTGCRTMRLRDAVDHRALHLVLRVQSG